MHKPLDVKICGLGTWWMFQVKEGQWICPPQPYCFVQILGSLFQAHRLHWQNVFFTGPVDPDTNFFSRNIFMDLFLKDSVFPAFWLYHSSINFMASRESSSEIWKQQQCIVKSKPMESRQVVASDMISRQLWRTQRNQKAGRVGKSEKGGKPRGKCVFF